MATLTNPIFSDEDCTSAWFDLPNQSETEKGDEHQLLSTGTQAYGKESASLGESTWQDMGVRTTRVALDQVASITAASVWAAAATRILEPLSEVNYTDTYFEELASTNPNQLISLIRSGHLRPSDLTFAAEILGRDVRSATAQRTLLSLLEHPAPLVREGAIYGIFHYLDSSEIRRSLEALSLSDPSPGVRAAAQDMLDV